MDNNYKHIFDKYDKSKNDVKLMELQNESQLKFVNDCYCVKSYFRVLNALKNSKNIDVYINEMILVTDLPYGEFTTYTQFAPGEYIIKVFESENKNEPIFEAEFLIDKNLVYTATLIGDILNPPEISLVMVPEAKEELNMYNMSTLRFVNLSSKAPKLNLVSNEEVVLFANVRFGEATDDVVIPANTYTLYLKNSENDEIVLIAPNVDLAPKMHYTLFLIDSNGNDDLMELIIPEDGVNYLSVC